MTAFRVEVSLLDQGSCVVGVLGLLDSSHWFRIVHFCTIYKCVYRFLFKESSLSDYFKLNYDYFNNKEMDLEKKRT